MLETQRSAAGEQITSISRNTSHPFSGFIRANIESVRESLWRYSCGAIISGGETGVNTAAFDIASRLRIPHSGLAPRGFINETGEINPSFKTRMIEVSDSISYFDRSLLASDLSRYPYARARTFEEQIQLNAFLSNATLILTSGEPSANDLVAFNTATRSNGANRVFMIDMSWDVESQTSRAREWLRSEPVALLNIAGSREGSSEVFGFSPYERSAEICWNVLR